MSMYIKPNFSTRTGFTLVEILVAVSIISILSAVVVWNQAAVTRSVSLSNAVNEFSVIVREAQVFGVGVRVAEENGGESFDLAYGVYGKIGENYLLLFADKDGNGKYSGTSACVTGNTQECLQKVTFSQVVIDDVCGKAGGSTKCKNNSATEAFMATFIRPSPQATLGFLNNGGNPIGSFTNDFMQIKLKSTDGSLCKVVNIYGVGQITTTDIC